MGTGFYMDDWRDLARVRTVGFFRSAEASRFASRPGAWVVDTLGYNVLRAQPLPWLILLTVLAAGTAIGLYFLLRAFVGEGVSLAVAALWLVLPNHESLRLFPNHAAIASSLLLLVWGLLAFERLKPTVAAVLLSLGISSYESAYVPAVAVLLALHFMARRCTRRQLGIALAAASVTVALMSIHPTYPLGSSRFGMPLPVVTGQFVTALTFNQSVGAVLWAVLAAGVVVAAVEWVQDGQPGLAGRLFVSGVAVVAVGLGGYVLRPPDGIRGFPDRMYGVSAIGTALIWCAVITALGRWVLARAALAVAFVAVVGFTVITYERNYSDVAHQSLAALRALDRRYHGRPPAGLTIGPEPLEIHGVRSLHDFYIRDATLVTLDHSFNVKLSESRAQWNATPPRLRITWDQLLKS